MSDSKRHDDLLKLRNVVGYGSGIKERGGKKTGEEATLVFVTKKTSAITAADRIPKAIDGKLTDVIEVGQARNMLLPECSLGVRREKLKPIRGGMQTYPIGQSVVGTLGAIVKDARTGNLVALTNAHVAHNPILATSADYEQLLREGKEFVTDGAVGRKMGSGFADDYEEYGEVVRSSVADFAYDEMEGRNTIDAAVVSIRSDIGVTTGIMGLTKYPQPFIHPASIPLGVSVYKSGRTTGTTRGEVLSTDTTISVYSSATISRITRKNIMFRSIEGQTVAEGGDSGSALCVDMGNGRFGIVGLVFAASSTPTNGYTYGYASRIDEIVNKLEIAPWDGTIIVPKEADGLDYASTGHGSLYVEDGTVLLNSTNDYLCATADDQADPALRACIDGNLTVLNAANVLTDNPKYTGAPTLVIIYTVLNTIGTGDAQTGLAVSLYAAPAAYADATYEVKPVLESRAIQGGTVDADMTWTLGPSLETVVATTDAWVATLDADAPLAVTAFEGYGVIGWPSSSDAEWRFAVAAQASATILDSVPARGEVIWLFGVGIDSETDGTAVGPTVSSTVAACTADESKTLVYGGVSR